MLNKIILLFVVSFFSISPVFAEEALPEPTFKYNNFNEIYKFNVDGSGDKIVDYSYTVLKDSVLSDSKQQYISYSTSVEKLDIIEAYTKKANGKRIDVDKSSYQLNVNSGKDNANPAFSDRTTLTVIFPDLEVGDTVQLSYKITQKEAIFPNQISENGFFYKNTLYDDARVTISYPSSMKVRYEAAMLTESKNDEKDGIKTIEWKFQNKKIVKDKRNSGNVYEFGDDPAYAFSTFASYSDIAKAYGERANKKAVVTEKIQKLADEITKDKKEPREQAKALYEWVAKNISYAGNCIGVGTVVPRDTDFVIDNRMGDCKDHATVLQALLAAKKIESSQALINVGNMYKLVNIPVVSDVNHVINYIPSLDMYVDSTAQDIPFGMLPQSEAGKPVLLVDNYKDGTKTPVIDHNSRNSVVKVKVAIADDGSAKGSLDLFIKGVDALPINAMMKDMTKEQEIEAMKALVKKYGFEGTAKLTREDKPKKEDEAKLSIAFDVKDYVRTGSSGALDIVPLFINQVIMGYKATEETPYSIMCSGGHYTEEYSYEFPNNMKILAIPDDFSDKKEIVSYEATYKQSGNNVNIIRKYDEPINTAVCDVNMVKIYKQTADKIIPNLRSQIVYKFSK